jgi:hypothetical protein
MPGSKYEAQSYYDGLEIALEQVSEQIVEDLETLSAEPPEDSESFSREAI